MASIPRVDERWLAQCRSGDAAAWSRLVEEFKRLVYSIPKRSGLSDEDAADVFQAAFLSLYADLNRIQNAESLPRWLTVVTLRETYRMKRARNKAPDALGETLEALLASEEESAELGAIEALEAEAVRTSLAAMHERCRELIAKLYIEEADYRQISEELNMPMGAIGPTRARCLQKLRMLLKKTGVFDNSDVSQPEPEAPFV